MERKLALLRRITNLQPIEGADRIELATVGGWKVVVAKEVGHKIGDLVVYCEVDSFLPIKPEYEFLRKSSYKKLWDGTEGFRLKTIKLRGQISQGLIMPMESVFGDFGWTAYEGLDVTEKLGIIKYDPPLPPELNGQAIGYFPDFMEKTDEERIQNLTDKWDELRLHKFYVTEKLDGTSATFFMKDGIFGVCSRNLQLELNESNTYWRVARELKIEENLRKLGFDNISIQGELVGEGIQKNRYNVKGQTVKFFSAFDIDHQVRFGLERFVNLMKDMELQSVPVLDTEAELPSTMDELISSADGKSSLNVKTKREGLVYRTHDRKYSFKVISNEWLAKNED